jgi:ribosomal protein S18 acetylase RimI-like enzyme
LNLTLRLSTGDDLAFITTLERHPDNRDFIGQWSDAEHLAAMRGEKRRSHRIVEVDGKPGGYMIWYDGPPDSPSLYLKRILVADKERGVGQAAMRLFLEEANSREDIAFAWLLVRDWNTRAQAVYTKLGFSRYEPNGDEADVLARYAEAPSEHSFRMRFTCRLAPSPA